MFQKGDLPLSAVQKRAIAQKIKEYKGLSREQRKDLLRELWQETAYTVGLRASTFAKSCSAKDGGKLYQLIMAGAVATDKAFPPKEQLDLNEVVNLFGSLGARGKAIVQPKVPLIEARVVQGEDVQDVESTPIEEDTPCDLNSLSPVSSLPVAFGWPDATKSNKSLVTPILSQAALIPESSRTNKSASRSSTKTKSSQTPSTKLPRK